MKKKKKITVILSRLSAFLLLAEEINHLERMLDLTPLKQTCLLRPV